MQYTGELNTSYEPLTGFESEYKIKLVDGIPKVKWIVNKKHAFRTTSNGYTRIYLHNKRYAIHRVAAKHYIDPSAIDYIVNFIDGDKKNIHINNLILKYKE